MERIRFVDDDIGANKKYSFVGSGPRRVSAAPTGPASEFDGVRDLRPGLASTAAGAAIPAAFTKLEFLTQASWTKLESSLKTLLVVLFDFAAPTI